MDLKELSKPLSIDEIDFRIQSINKGGYATILVYKDARVDINRLNAVCGSLGWERRHTRDNHNCIVSIWDDEKQHWVSKEDTGTESNTEKEKGLASDSFKRSCFNWGIGIELYDYPLIQIKLNGGTDQKQEWWINPKKKDKWGNPKPDTGWGLHLKQWKWHSEFTEDGKLSYLAAKDEKGKVRFEYKSGNTHTSGDEINPEKVDLDRVEKAYAYIVAQINNEEQDDITCAENLQKFWPKVSNDERNKINEKLSVIKHQKRQYNTILKGYLEMNTNIGE
jgi:hypothetical protein